MKPNRPAWMRHPIVVVLRYWLLQGMLYMNRVELFHRLLLELLLVGVTWGMLRCVGVDDYLLPLALVIGHTLNAILNGHLPALVAHDLFWYAAYKDRDRFFAYVDELACRLRRKRPAYVACAAFFGSLTRGEFRPTSDLDIRVVPISESFADAFWSAHLVFVERLRALWAGFPIDIYMFRSRAEVARKMDLERERAVYVYGEHATVEGYFSDALKYDEFRKAGKNGAV